MKLLITNDNNHILSDSNQSYLSSFTEYGMKFSNIQLYNISENIKNSNLNNNDLILVPMTHINNLWHLLHHLFITYKYIQINKIECDTMYPIFFKGFYKKQGNISESIYNDLIFKGLGLDYNKFKNHYDVFKRNEYITVNNIYHVNKSINFHNEPLFNEFKKTILNNFDIKYNNNSSKNITFILRKGKREITNIDSIKDTLKSYNINYIYLENHTIKEQLEIISNTDILLGVHGAGLSWGIFMKNNSIMIEMYPGNSNTDNYIRWCNLANIQYKRLCINITNGTVNDFRNSTVNINDKQLQIIKNYL